MKRKEKGVHPDLIALVTGVRPPADEMPTVAMLPGKAACLVARRIKKIEPIYKPNKQRLRCLHCGHAAVYDIGMTVFDGAGWAQVVESGNSLSNPESDFDTRRNLIDNAQFTGYIRCVKCNGAGAWEFTSSLFTLGLLGRVMRAKEDPDAGFMFGKIQLHDGTCTQWMSEGEERFLERLRTETMNSYLWNKLGNLYEQGGQPELAAAVFEHAVGVDVMQVESHYSLANLLLEIGESELAAKHFRQALVYARLYTNVEALKLRQFLADGLCKLLDIHHETKQKVPFLPTEEELAAVMQQDETAFGSQVLHAYEFDLRPGDMESFLPVAEMYMGKRTEEIPEHERKLHKPSSAQMLKKGVETMVTKNKKDYSEKNWGSERQPIIVKVKSEERAAQVARACDHFNWHYIMGMEYTEDLTDLKKAIREKYAPANVYEPCPCGSGEKYKFCCAKTMKNFDLNDYLKTFENASSS
ncbi:SEC-C metal-binding domain-containing protein [Paenibacillus medicaginis]|uniref:SEC-C metal-binding domain-containing protein n=1 Tax=Paenibacillus medicaginis TaxID=1470560 RepID=A0ABV5C6U3_9BACL